MSIEELKAIATKYHDLDPNDVDEILDPDFLGEHWGGDHTWDRESHRHYTSTGNKEDIIHEQFGEGDTICTRFTRKTVMKGEDVAIDAGREVRRRCRDDSRNIAARVDDDIPATIELVKLPIAIPDDAIQVRKDIGTGAPPMKQSDAVPRRDGRLGQRAPDELSSTDDQNIHKAVLFFPTASRSVAPELARTRSDTPSSASKPKAAALDHPDPSFVFDRISILHTDTKPQEKAT